MHTYKDAMKKPSENLLQGKFECCCDFHSWLLLPLLKRFWPLLFLLNGRPWLPYWPPLCLFLLPPPVYSTIVRLPSFWRFLRNILLRRRFILNPPPFCSSFCAFWASWTSAAPKRSMRALRFYSSSSEVIPIWLASSIDPNRFIRSCFFASNDSLVSIPNRSYRYLIRYSEISFVTIPNRSALSIFLRFYSSMSLSASIDVAASWIPGMEPLPPPPNRAYLSYFRSCIDSSPICLTGSATFASLC